MLLASNGYLNLLDPLNAKLLESKAFHFLGTEPIFIENKMIIITSEGDLKVYN